jgi:hypothetical protein
MRHTRFLPGFHRESLLKEGDGPAGATMRRTMGRIGFLVLAALSAGCVERRFVIESNPPAAQVFRNGQSIGFTPCDDAFVYYGEYEFTLVKDGYETLKVRPKIRSPWYEIPPLDFFAENIWPFKVRDVRRLKFQMQPLRTVTPDEVLRRAEQLRIRGRQIGDIPAPPLPVAPAAAVTRPVTPPATPPVAPALGAPVPAAPAPPTR